MKTSPAKLHSNTTKLRFAILVPLSIQGRQLAHPTRQEYNGIANRIFHFLPMRLIFYFLLYFGFYLFTACTKHPHPITPHQDSKAYASLLHITECDSFTQVTLQDAWQPERIAATYLLIDRQRPVPTHLPQGKLIRTPLQKVVLTSAIHAALLTELGAGASIKGLADTDYIVSPQVKALLRTGTKNIGSSMRPNTELIRTLQADAIFVSPFENAGFGGLEQLNIPLIICADYMETSPLGRAEWMRFYGRLVGVGEKADSLFQATVATYEKLRQQAAHAQTPRPTVFCDLRYGATWYQPGGNSTMGRFITDAGGDYLWADRTESGSIPLHTESVMAKAQHAAIWLVKQGTPRTLTYASLAADYPPYTHFGAWKQRHIWVCNTLQTPFYEEIPFHPERLLQNLMEIFHPELKTEKGNKYYVKMKE